ncbi:FAD-dependent oxidoreductase [Demequina soli]|uniref:FAD-dependent oxidoreductase n=1 Tax=Demequina soli TaxID=1638987 RepID=UPI00078209EF|nr:FAD-dependent monooxygenase [Demequina soli]
MTADGERVIVVGAGPVGMAVALGLAHHGVRSVLVERRAEPSAESKAFGAWGRTLDALDAWGLADAVVAAGEPREVLAPVAVATGRPIFRVDLRAQGTGGARPGLVVLPQPATEAVLRAAVAASGLIRTVRGEVVEVRADDAGVTVGLAWPDGDRLSMRAAYVVGADGARSRVREAVGARQEGEALDVALLVCDVDVDGGGHLPPVLLAADRPGLLAAIRLDGGRWRVIAARRGTVPEPAEELARTIFGDHPVRVVWESRTAAYQARVPSFRAAPRVLLAGDAAHLVSPAGGQGMNQGLQDAECLAWSLAAALRAEDTGDHAAADAMLDGYARERERIADTVARRARLNGLLEFRTPPWLRPPAFLALRAATRLPWFTRALARRLTMRDLRYRPADVVRLRAGQRTGPVGRRVPDLGATALEPGRAFVLAVACDPPAPPAGPTAVRVESPPPGTRLYRGDVAVVRPDRHVGAVLRRPDASSLREAVRAALGPL